MDFSAALHQLREGRRLTRLGWNGRGQYVVLQKGYPDGIPINANTAEAIALPADTILVFLPYFMIHTVNGSFVPWVASQMDLLADDWVMT